MALAGKGRASLNNLSGGTSSRAAAVSHCRVSPTWAHWMDGYPKSFWIYVTVSVPLWSLNHLLPCVHAFRSACAFHPGSLFGRKLCLSRSKTARALFQLESLGPHCFSPPSLLLNYWRVFPVPVLKLFSLDLGHVPRP